MAAFVGLCSAEIPQEADHAFMVPQRSAVSPLATREAERDEIFAEHRCFSPAFLTCRRCGGMFYAPIKPSVWGSERR